MDSLAQGFIYINLEYYRDSSSLIYASKSIIIFLVEHGRKELHGGQD